MVKTCVACFLQVGDQGEAKSERFHRTEPQYDDSSTNCAYRLRLTIERGVDSLEDLAGQGRIVPNRISDPLHADVLLGEIDNFEGDGWEAR